MNDKEVFIEDDMNEVIADCLVYTKSVTPGSNEHIAAVNEATVLYSTQAKYASEEAQRDHDKEMKMMDMELRNRDLSIRERELDIRQEELETQKKQAKLDNVVKCIDVGAKTVGIAGVLGTMFLALKAECGDNRFMSSGVWKWASSLGNKFIRPM